MITFYILFKHPVFKLWTEDEWTWICFLNFNIWIQISRYPWIIFKNTDLKIVWIIAELSSEARQRSTMGKKMK